MILGYADESGEPGVKKNDHDYFVFCVIFIGNKEELSKIEKKIKIFRKKHGLPDDHEFHYAKDSKKTRFAFVKFISGLSFEFLFVAIKKDNYRDTASFANMADLTLSLLEKKGLNVNVIMDINPGLYKELRGRKKKYAVNLRFSERQSHANDLIQVADYVTTLSTRALKYPQKLGVTEMYSLIAKKRIGFAVI